MGDENEFSFSLSVVNPSGVILQVEPNISVGKEGLGSSSAFSFYNEKHEVDMLAISKSPFGKIASEE